MHVRNLGKARRWVVFGGQVLSLKQLEITPLGGLFLSLLIKFKSRDRPSFSHACSQVSGCELRVYHSSQTTERASVTTEMIDFRCIPFLLEVGIRSLQRRNVWADRVIGQSEIDASIVYVSIVSWYQHMMYYIQVRLFSDTKKRWRGW